ncbi:hypothetical protein [Herbaspirillum lusitanum]|uniref:hypothetical protein n=1 Tax=Herbaspirillum lusitanum TaxID=213312 RepID=UPI00036DC64E|nr:hypothetical protein [Herbaspirillum lusitanum]
MPLAISSLHDGMRADGVRVRWVAALADVGNHNDTVEIVAAYVMTQESRMMTVYLWRVVAAVALTVLLTSVLGFAVLRRDLMPLTRMSRRGIYAPSRATPRSTRWPTCSSITCATRSPGKASISC